MFKPPCHGTVTFMMFNPIRFSFRLKPLGTRMLGLFSFSFLGVKFYYASQLSALSPLHFNSVFGAVWRYVVHLWRGTVPKHRFLHALIVTLPLDFVALPLFALCSEGRPDGPACRGDPASQLAFINKPWCWDRHPATLVIERLSLSRVGKTINMCHPWYPGRQPLLVTRWLSICFPRRLCFFTCASLSCHQASGSRICDIFIQGGRPWTRGILEAVYDLVLCGRCDTSLFHSHMLCLLTTSHVTDTISGLAGC
jgi:hypothetical protein